MGTMPVVPGIALALRFLVCHFIQMRSGHVQSMIVGIAAIMLGFGIMMIGLLGDIISANRKLNEEIIYRLKNKKTV